MQQQLIRNNDCQFPKSGLSIYIQFIRQTIPGFLLPIIMNGRNIFESNSTIQQNLHHFTFNSRCYLAFSLVDWTAKVAIICFHDRFTKLRQKEPERHITFSLLSKIIQKKFFQQVISIQNRVNIPGSLTKIQNYFDFQIQPSPNASTHFNSFTLSHMKSQYSVIIKTSCF